MTPEHFAVRDPIKLDYETRAALGLNDKTAFSCMPTRARELVQALSTIAKIAAPGNRTLDELCRDLHAIYDIARATRPDR